MISTISITIFICIFVVLAVALFFQLAIKNLARVFAILLPFDIQLFASISHMELNNKTNRATIAKLLRDLKKRAKKSKVPQVASINLNHHGASRLFDVHYVYRFGVSTLCLTDVTDIELLQNKLVTQIKAEHQVFHNLNTGISIFDKDHKLVFFNAMQSKIWGVSDIVAGIAIDEVLNLLKQNKTLPKSLESDDFINSEKKLFNNLTESKKQIIYLPDGRIIQHVSTPYPDGGILQSGEDITEITTLEQDMTDLLSVYRNTLDNIREGIAVINGQGYLQLSNPAFAEIWHLKQNFLDSMPHYEVVLEKIIRLLDTHIDTEPFKNRITRIIGKRRGMETRIHLKTGSIIRMAALPISEQRLLLICRDITLQEQHTLQTDAEKNNPKKNQYCIA